MARVLLPRAAAVAKAPVPGGRAVAGQIGEVHRQRNRSVRRVAGEVRHRRLRAATAILEGANVPARALRPRGALDVVVYGRPRIVACVAVTLVDQRRAAGRDPIAIQPAGIRRRGAGRVGQVRIAEGRVSLLVRIEQAAAGDGIPCVVEVVVVVLPVLVRLPALVVDIDRHVAVGIQEHVVEEEQVPGPAVAAQLRVGVVGEDRPAGSTAVVQRVVVEIGVPALVAATGWGGAVTDDVVAIDGVLGGVVRIGVPILGVGAPAEASGLGGGVNGVGDDGVLQDVVEGTTLDGESDAAVVVQVAAPAFTVVHPYPVTQLVTRRTHKLTVLDVDVVGLVGLEHVAAIGVVQVAALDVHIL